MKVNRYKYLDLSVSCFSHCTWVIIPKSFEILSQSINWLKVATNHSILILFHLLKLHDVVLRNVLNKQQCALVTVHVIVSLRTFEDGH